LGVADTGESVLLSFKTSGNLMAGVGKVLEYLENLGGVGEAVMLFDLHSAATGIKNIDSSKVVVRGSIVNP